MGATDNRELLRIPIVRDENIDWSRSPARNMKLLWSAARHDNCDVAVGIVKE
jgi:hypothetical protein